MGRPLELNEQLIARAWAYLKGGYKEQGNAVPSVAGLAFALGKSRDTVYAWAKINAEFSDILGGIAVAQEMLLIDGTLTGDFNPTFAKLLMTKHGYSDKVDNNHTSSDGTMSPLSVEQFAQIARAVADKV